MRAGHGGPYAQGGRTVRFRSIAIRVPLGSQSHTAQGRTECARAPVDQRGEPGHHPGRLDQGEDATQQDVTRAVTVMKQYVDDVVLRVCDNGVLILGGYGFIREYPAELWLRNARGFASFDGLAIA